MNRWHLWYLAMAYADLGQLDDAWRCIDDAIDKDRKVDRKMGRRPRSIALPVRSRSSHPRGIRKKQKSILIAHSLSRVSSKQNPGSCARR